MAYVAIVTVLALLQFVWLGLSVGRARAKYGIHAPATSGNEVFERHFRVHMNTLEQLVLFLPSLWIFANYVSPIWAAGLGVVFIIGRFIYASTYVRDPKSRSLGFALTALPSFGMMAGILWWAVGALVSTAN
ncbi:MAG: MAPEG family protein [Steroidobacter sp.]